MATTAAPQPGLVRVYGNKAVVFHHNKQNFMARNGVLDIPQALLGRALATGFSRNAPPPDPEPVIAPIASSKPTGAPVPPVPPVLPEIPTVPAETVSPATSTIAPPAAHPQAEEAARLAEEQRKRDEKREGEEAEKERERLEKAGTASTAKGSAARAPRR